MEPRFFEPSIFRTSRFSEPWHVSLGFASVKHSNLTPDFSDPPFFETPDISNQFLPPTEEICKKFTFDFLNPYEIFKVLLSSFHLNGRTSRTQKSFYHTVNSTKESTAQCLSFEWPLIRHGFSVGAFYYVYTVVLTFELSVMSCHLRFFQLPIFRTNFRFPRKFEKSGFHCMFSLPLVLPSRLLKFPHIKLCKLTSSEQFEPKYDYAFYFLKASRLFTLLQRSYNCFDRISTSVWPTRRISSSTPLVSSPTFTFTSKLNSCLHGSCLCDYN